MIGIKPFKAYRPQETYVEQIAALPYDVVTNDEVKRLVKDNPYSFLNVDKAEARLEDLSGDRVYEEAKSYLQWMIEKDLFVHEKEECYYVYGLEINEIKQYGIVGCFACEDYEKNVIKKHEKTRKDKEQDRVKHVAYCQAHTGPIFLSYKHSVVIQDLINEIKLEEPIYDFTDTTGLRQVVYRIHEVKQKEVIEEGFRHIDALYIADGHHRAAAACSYAKDNVTKEHSEANYFLGVAFPKDELCIIDYNRVVEDESGLSKEQLFEEIKKYFSVEEVDEATYKPEARHIFGMRYGGIWYKLRLKEGKVDEGDVINRLDVAILQNILLEPLFKIADPRTDHRIEFVGGIRGIEALNEKTNDSSKIAFALYPTSFDDIIAVADQDKLMPPKSTWFEPKLRSGLFIHTFLDV